MINDKPFRAASVSGMSRRSFLAGASTTIVAGSIGGAALLTRAADSANANNGPAKAYVGSNVYGWTQYYQRDKKPFDLPAVLGDLHELGYDYLEGNLDSNQPENNAKLAAEMKSKGLIPLTLYTGAALHQADKAKETVSRILSAARVAHGEGFRLLSVNADPIGREKTDAELANQAAALGDLGKGLNEIGMRMGVHHHTPEMANHAREFHYNFRHTDPKTVGFNYDVHWVFRGGIPPKEALPEYGDRVISYHLRQSRGGIWWEDLDSGDIDYAWIAQYIADHHLARVFTVELALENGTKITRSAIENHRRSREFVRRVFGA